MPKRKSVKDRVNILRKVIAGEPVAHIVAPPATNYMFVLINKSDVVEVDGEKMTKQEWGVLRQKLTEANASFSPTIWHEQKSYVVPSQIIAMIPAPGCEPLGPPPVYENKKEQKAITGPNKADTALLPEKIESIEDSEIIENKPANEVEVTDPVFSLRGRRTLRYKGEEIPFEEMGFKDISWSSWINNLGKH